MHLTRVTFHPEQYPMSFTWLTGKMTVSEVQHHHPAWFEELKTEGEVEGGKAESDAKEQERPVG